MMTRLLMLYCCIALTSILAAQDSTSLEVKKSLAETIDSISSFGHQVATTAIFKQSIHTLPFRDIHQFSLTTPAAYNLPDRGLFLYGLETSGNYIFVDGMPIQNADNFPFRSIQQLNVLGMNAPIDYGNATGGFLALQTNQAIQDFSIKAEMVSSTPFSNALGNHLMQLDVAIPLGKAKGGLKPSLLIASQFSRTNDINPSKTAAYQLAADGLSNLKAQPLVLSTTNQGLVNTANFLSMEQIEQRPFRQNAGQQAMGTYAKLTLPIHKNVVASVGSFMSLQDERVPIYENALLNAENNPQQISRNFDSYARLAYRSDRDKKWQHTAQVQLHHASYFKKNQHPVHQDDFFRYGHVGQFETNRAPVYNIGSVGDLTGLELVGYQDKEVFFSPSDINPTLANYTQTVFNQINPINNLSQVFQYGGLSNGAVPNGISNTYGLWRNVGMIENQYSEQKDEQWRTTASYEANLKNKHTFKIGGEYTKYRHRRYDIQPSSLWNVMQSEISLPGREILLDTSNPVLVIGGQNYTLAEYENLQNMPGNTIHFSPSDTITYPEIHYSPSFFDSQFREQFGYGEFDFVDVYAPLPNEFSMDMFTADNLWQGDVIGTYAGYDFRGNRQGNGGEWADFWTARDEHGNFTRPIPAARPVYAAAYGTYEFKHKWFDLMLGGRMDYYKSNQPVLRNPYSFYPIHTAAEVTELNGQTVTHPEAIGNDYFVYVDNSTNPNEIKGYRDNDQWYNAAGEAILDPSPLETGGSLRPYLYDNLVNDIKSPDFDFDASFTQAKAVTNWLPKVGIQIYPTKTTKIFAHYQSFTQIPDINISRFRPEQYVYLLPPFDQQVFNNGALEPVRVDKFHGGISQKMSQAFEASVSYFRHGIDANRIQFVPFAHPSPYETYTHHRTFVRHGLNVSLAYRLQASSGFKLALHYTQLNNKDIESNTISGLISYLEYDPESLVKHNLTGYMQYDFGSGASYKGFKTKAGKQVLSDLSISLFHQFRTGAGYAKNSNIIPEAYDPNAFSFNTFNLFTATLPRYMTWDLKIEKGFQLTQQKMSINFYVWVQNLLNQTNVLKVYGATGSPTNDDFLISDSGIGIANSQIDTQSFEELYTLKLQNPANIGQGRITRMGVSLGF